ncbi:hypothetical protein OS493_013568 [Desmophyllum pertusum]|uniref:Uncharacterized protein n=1 Tax=Desmophyllum pertusum TaxID=174260 RepID=A0A9X0A3I9_9CNID|nr:hypothetical protein OS493_013568 [Desmophyllum pertusum]
MDRKGNPKPEHEWPTEEYWKKPWWMRSEDELDAGSSTESETEQEDESDAGHQLNPRLNKRTSQTLGHQLNPRLNKKTSSRLEQRK